MANKKARTKPEKCKAQFARTVSKTGKWRGKKASEYKKYKRTSKPTREKWEV